MKYSKPLLVGAFALASTALPMSHAATTTNTMAVSLTVVGTCAVATTPMVFGPSSSTISSDVDATSTLEVVCTTGTAYDITMDIGTGAGASYAARQLTNASDSTTVNYNLYTDPGYAVVWDDDNTKVTGTGDNTAQDFTVYGRVPSGQTASQGDFTDTIVVTLTF